MFIHLLKNFIKQSKKEMGYTMLLIFTVALGLVFALCIIGLLELETGNIAPEVNRKRTLYLNEVMFLKDGKKIIRNTPGHNDKFTSSFLSEYVKTMKTPEKVCIFTVPNRNGHDFSEHDLFSTNNFKTCMTDAEFWDILSFKFIHGKPYTTRQVESAKPVAVIDKKLSLFLFGTTESVGKTFQNKGTPWKELTVVGVIEKVNPLSSFASNVYSPYTIYGYEDKFRNEKDERNGYYFYRGFFEAILLARDKDDFPVIKAELDKIVSRINQTRKIEEFEGVLPNLYDPYEKLIFSWSLDEIGPGIGSILGSFFFIILLIPVFTIVKINTSRIADRMQELGVRRSFGAQRHHILLQFLYENLLITFIGGLLGLILSALIFNFLLSIAYPDQDAVNFVLNGSSLVWSIVVIFIFSLFTGIIPAWKASQLHPVYALSEGKTGLFVGNKKAYDKVSGLAIGGIFTCMLLLICFMLVQLIPIAKMYWVSKLNAHGFGIRAEDDKAYDANFQYLKNEFIKIDGVKHVSFTDTQPLGAFGLNDYETPTGKHKAKFFKVDESFDVIIGIEMISGNWFEPTESSSKPNHKKTIISHDAADLFFGTINCIGQSFQDQKGVNYQIVGINKTKVMRTQGSLENFQVFVYSPELNNQALIQLHEGADIKTVWKELEKKVSLAPGVSLYAYKSVKAEYFSNYEILFPLIKGMGVILFIMLANASVGFFAIGWSQVRKRKKEIGVRRASGARQIRIFRMILGEHLKTTLIAIGIVMIPISQLTLFFAGGQWKMEYWVLASGISFTITLVCILLAAYFPARRAAATDPVIALSEE